jgi:hypothetical protein
MVDPNLSAAVEKRFKPFQDEILSSYQDKIHSLTITGSALTEDFDPGQSDVNSVIVFNKMELQLLELMAPLGKKYGKKRIAAPLIMTPEYIMNSLDVFPMEFLNIKLIHKTVFGEDLFQALEINRLDLRLQCERELKVRLIGLRQAYISSAGDIKTLTDMFINTISGYIPLFRGIVLVLGKEPPTINKDVLISLEESSGVNTGVFKDVLKQKKHKSKLTIKQLNTFFEDYYAAIEKLGDVIDDIKE